jgi:hypothetical protein
MSVRASKSPIERLDDLYKLLLAPTTFLVFVGWTSYNYFVQTMLGHPELSKSWPITFVETDLLLASRLLNAELSVFVLSIVSFLIVAMERRGKAAAAFRFLAFWGLTFTLGLVGAIFIQAEWPFILMPVPSGDMILYSVGAVSFFLSLFIVWRAYSRHPGDYQGSK